MCNIGFNFLFENYQHSYNEYQTSTEVVYIDGNQDKIHYLIVMERDRIPFSKYY